MKAGILGPVIGTEAPLDREAAGRDTPGRRADIRTTPYHLVAQRESQFLGYMILLPEMPDSSLTGSADGCMLGIH